MAGFGAVFRDIGESALHEEIGGNSWSDLGDLGRELLSQLLAFFPLALRNRVCRLIDLSVESFDASTRPVLSRLCFIRYCGPTDHREVRRVMTPPTHRRDERRPEPTFVP